MDIQITPIVTEKATRLQEKLNRYTFRVSPDANKHQIKSLVEQLYGVKVEAVNTMQVRGEKTAHAGPAAACSVARPQPTRKPW